jgi:hypothetical protein
MARWVKSCPNTRFSCARRTVCEYSPIALARLPGRLLYSGSDSKSGTRFSRVQGSNPCLSANSLVFQLR